MNDYDEDGGESICLKAQIADLEEALVEVIRHHGYIGDISPKASSIVAIALHKANARSPQEE